MVMGRSERQLLDRGALLDPGSADNARWRGQEMFVSLPNFPSVAGRPGSGGWFWVSAGNKVQQTLQV